MNVRDAYELQALKPGNQLLRSAAVDVLLVYIPLNRSVFPHVQQIQLFLIGSDNIPEIITPVVSVLQVGGVDTQVCEWITQD